MVTVSAPFRDIEKILITGLPGALNLPPGVTLGIGTIYPLQDGDSEALRTPVPFIKVGLLTDTDDRFTLASDVTIETFDSTRARAYALAQQTRSVLLGARRLGGEPIDSVSTTSGPKVVPWDIAGMVRILATYRITTRR